jgi:hypothetical protein
MHALRLYVVIPQEPYNNADDKFKDVIERLNFVSNIMGATQTEGVWEQRAEENIWTEERWSDGRLEETE